MALNTPSDLLEPVADLLGTEVAGYSVGALAVSGVAVGLAVYIGVKAARKATENLFA